MKKFKSDGCSLWPDRDYGYCCVQHDKVYHRGGTVEDRLFADIHLKYCVGLQGKPITAQIMFWGVRLFGAPWWPTPFRWGFGRRYRDSWGYNKRQN